MSFMPNDDAAQFGRHVRGFLAKHSAERKPCSTWLSAMPGPVTSSAGRSDRSRQSSTVWRRYSCVSSLPGSVVYFALHESQANPSTRPTEAALARATASEVFLACASDNIQIHGGIGFTWEHAAHLYLKRAKSSSLLFGDPVLARRRLAERLRIVEVVP